LSYNELNGQAETVSGAQIILFGGNETFTFKEDIDNPGSYLSENAFSASLNTDYVLEINWNGESFTAENKMEQVIPFTKLTFKSEGIDSLSLAGVPSLYSPHEQSMYEIDIDWSHLIPSDTSRAKLFYYTFNTLDVNEIFRPPKKTVIFPKGSIVIEKKYSLNPEFADYFRALLMETEWQGGVFDEASASLPTNIDNGGLGFFGVCAVLSDTLVAE